MNIRKIPKWIKDLPYELDRVALTQLIGSSKNDSTTPREMNFVLCNFTTKEACRHAEYYIKAEGWTTSIFKQPDNTYDVTATKNGYILTEQAYIDDSQFFLRIAKLLKVKYDGWFASNN